MLDIIIVICLTVSFLALLAARYFNPAVEEIIEKVPVYEQGYSKPVRFDVTIKRTYKNGAVKIVKKRM